MKSALMIFFVLACMLLMNCSPKSNTHTAIFAGNGSAGIINGVDVTAEDPLAKQVVMFHDGVETFCTGTLIAKDIVLTAAHCLRSGKMYVGFSVDGNPKNVARLRPHRVIDYKLPEGFEIGEDGEFRPGADVLDMMIVKFDNGTPDGFVPAELFESESIYPPEIDDAKVVTALGYGVTDGEKQTGSGSLRKARMRISRPVFGRTEFGADGSFSGTCQGDSGGPAFLKVGDKHVVVGVLSRGEDGCKGEMFYTKVNAYTQWIKDTIAEFSADGIKK